MTISKTEIVLACTWQISSTESSMVPHKINIKNCKMENQSETWKSLICIIFHIFNHSNMKNIVSTIKDLSFLPKTFIMLCLFKNYSFSIQILMLSE